MAHLSFILHVFLVPNQENDDRGLALSHHLVVPCAKILKCVQPRYVIGQKNTMRSSVKDFSYTLELFLACCVPNLQLKYLLL